MSGPTTEVLNEDVKEVRVDIHDIRVDVGIIKACLHRATEDIKEIREDLVVIKAGSRNISTSSTELRTDIRDFTRWMVVLALLASAMNIFATICFLTDFRFFAPAG